MTLASIPVYASDPECIALLFDLRYPGTWEQVHRLRVVWQAESDLEALGPNHVVVYLFPGTDRRIAA